MIIPLIDVLLRTEMIYIHNRVSQNQTSKADYLIRYMTHPFPGPGSPCVFYIYALNEPAV